MINPSHNAKVSFETRRWLTARAAEGELLTYPAAQPLFRLLHSSTDRQPGGLFYQVAKELGAIENDALKIGSIIEMFFSCVNALDDIEDGDLEATPTNVNACFHLMSMGLHRAQIDYLGGPASEMLLGQFLDLTHKKNNDWNLQNYLSVSHKIAGSQFALYTRITCELSSRIDFTSQMVPLGKILGLLLQVMNDLEQQDQRLLQSEPNYVFAYLREQLEAHQQMIDSCPSPTFKQLLLDALPFLDKVNLLLHNRTTVVL